MLQCCGRCYRGERGGREWYSCTVGESELHLFSAYERRYINGNCCECQTPVIGLPPPPRQRKGAVPYEEPGGGGGRLTRTIKQKTPAEEGTVNQSNWVRTTISRCTVVVERMSSQRFFSSGGETDPPPVPLRSAAGPERGGGAGGRGWFSDAAGPVRRRSPGESAVSQRVGGGEALMLPVD